MSDLTKGVYGMITDKEFEHALAENWNICTYGLGYLGKRLYKEIPDIFGLKANFFCDGNDEKVDSVQLPEMTGIYRNDLIRSENPVLVFILVDDPYDIEIQDALSVNRKLHTLTLREMAQMSIVMRSFYGEDLYNRYLGLKDYRMKG